MHIFKGNCAIASPTLPAYATVGGKAYPQPDPFIAWWVMTGKNKGVTGQFHLN